MPPGKPIAAEAGWRLSDLARVAGATLDGDGSLRITHVASFDTAGPGAIAFIGNRKYRTQLATSRATAVIVTPDIAALTDHAKLVSANPYATYAKVAALLHPSGSVSSGVHPSAVIAADARLATSANIAAYAVIGDGATIGERATIGAGCVIGAGATIGDDALLHPNVTVYHRCVVGPRAIVHSGAVIGADGFGMAEEGGRWLKIPQLGRVVIGADVEIGANTTIDRGAIDDTVIEDDVKLDNQIQIGHNCRIGAHTAIAGCVGIAGSVRIGRNCKIGGAAMITGHLDIADGTTVSAATVIQSTVDRPGMYTGVFPMAEHSAWKRTAVELRHLSALAKRLRVLERASTVADTAASSVADPDVRSVTNDECGAMDMKAILLMLPHRYPMLLIDRVLTCVPGERLRAIKNVTINEPFFAGHFPAFPVMPGVMLIEALAQASAILAHSTAGTRSQADTLFFFTGIDNARFRRQVVPGDQLILEVEVLRIVRGVGKFATVAKVGDDVAAEAELMAALRPANISC